MPASNGPKRYASGHEERQQSAGSSIVRAPLSSTNPFCLTRPADARTRDRVISAIGPAGALVERLKELQDDAGRGAPDRVAFVRCVDDGIDGLSGERMLAFHPFPVGRIRQLSTRGSDTHGPL